MPPHSELDTRAAADLRCRQAAGLEARGEVEAAKQAYLAILAATPDHAPTLNRLGALLYRRGFTQAAQTAYRQAIDCHPDQPHGHVNLAHLLREGGDLDGAQAHYAAALAADPGVAAAHQGLGHVLAARGDSAGAERHWRLGFCEQPQASWPYRGRGAPVRVLMPISVADGNLAARPFLDDQRFAVTTLAMEFCRPAQTLPPHDLVLNAIGDADLCGAALAATLALVRRTAAPVINAPSRVLATGRVQTARRMADIPGVVAPRMQMFARARLQAADAAALLAAHGFAWPLLLRAPGFHTGQHFVRVDAPEALAAAAAALPGEDLLVIAWLDAAGADGQVRKGRVLFIDGDLYPLHWAVAAQWKVHYFTAGMAASAAYRAEEARFLADMAGFLGPAAMAALRAIALRLGLEYGGVDFALAPDGRLLLFEANATMAIVAPLADPIWDYRRPAAAAAVQATQTMLLGRAAGR